MNTIKKPTQALLNGEGVFLRYVYPDTDLSKNPESHSVVDINKDQFEQIKSIVQKKNRAKLVDGTFQDI